MNDLMGSDGLGNENENERARASTKILAYLPSILPSFPYFYMYVCMIDRSISLYSISRYGYGYEVWGIPGERDTHTERERETHTEREREWVIQPHP